MDKYSIDPCHIVKMNTLQLSCFKDNRINLQKSQRKQRESLNFKFGFIVAKAFKVLNILNVWKSKNPVKMYEDHYHI